MLDENAPPDQAIRCFVEAEERHGVRILYSPGVSLAESVVPIDDSLPAPSEILRLYHSPEFEERHRVIRLATDEQYDACERAALFPFLSETSFLVSGEDMGNDLLVICSSNLVTSWSQRAWGAMLARWAATTGWNPPYRGFRLFRPNPSTCDYLPYTYYLRGSIHRYDEWLVAVREGVRLKTERQVAEPQGQALAVCHRD